MNDIQKIEWYNDFLKKISNKMMSIDRHPKSSNDIQTINLELNNIVIFIEENNYQPKFKDLKHLLKQLSNENKKLIKFMLKDYLHELHNIDQFAFILCNYVNDIIRDII